MTLPLQTPIHPKEEPHCKKQKEEEMKYKKGLKILLIVGFVIGVAWQAHAADPAATPPLGAGQQVYSSVDPDNAVIAVAQSVLIALADDTSNGTTLQSELLALGIATVDLMNVRDYTPSLSELQSYDAVITWANYAYLDKVAMGNVLADYVDGGGGVVMGNFVWYSPTFDLAGRIQDPGYSPFEQAGASLYLTACLGSNDPSHPIMSGVTAACDGVRCHPGGQLG
jgi:hypothetical protein